MLRREMTEYYNHGQWVDYIEHNMNNANIAKSIDSEVIVVTANNGYTLAKFDEDEGYGYIFEGRKLNSGTPFIKERRRASDF